MNNSTYNVYIFGNLKDGAATLVASGVDYTEALRRAGGIAEGMEEEGLSLYRLGDSWNERDGHVPRVAIYDALHDPIAVWTIKR